MYLNTHSYFSLRYGTFSIDSLVEEALKQNIKTLALTDINNTSGMIDFVRVCRENDIRPMGGIEFRNGNEYLYTGLAKNNEGLRELNEFLTYHNLNKKEFSYSASGFENAYVIYPFGSKGLNELKDHEFIGIKPNDVLKLFTSDYLKDQSKLVIQQPVTYADSKGYTLHRNLRAVDNNILLSQLISDMLAEESEVLLPIDNLLEFYSNYPQIIKNTEKLINDCEIDFDYKSFKNKKTFTGNPTDDQQLLIKLAMEGLDYRYGKKDKTAKERVEHELKIIFKLGFASYVLITWDIIRYSMSRGYYHVGRGSGANSVVAFCLKITDVDPIDLNLYFERFINPRRSSPPDFDIDYSWREREDVQDYIFKRYGHKHTALLGATSTFKGKSIFRELGKVYGLPKKEIDALVDNPETEVHKNYITKRIYKISKK